MRPLRFVLVGGLCFGVQYAIMVALASLGVPWPVANAVGFGLSAQLNFVLSSMFTWGDRVQSRPGPRWLSFNASVALGLTINTVVFSVLFSHVGHLLAMAAGVGSSMVVTFLVGNYVVFRRRGEAAGGEPR